MKGSLIAILLGVAFVGLSLLPADGSRAQPVAKSIIVLKLDDATGQPQPGWEITLYEGPECQGTPIGEAITDLSGMVDFFELEPAIYSVAETPHLGYETLSPICQTVDLTDPPPPPGPCPVSPNLPYPDEGCDVFSSGAAVKLDLSPIGQGVQRATLNGPTQVARYQNPLDPYDGDSDGRRDFDTEIVHLNLSGLSALGPITVSESASRDSTGVVEEQSAGGGFFTADSFFDVFVDIQSPVGPLHNNQPVRLECEVDSIPPIGCFYFPPIPDPIPLFDAEDDLVGYIMHAAHIPLPDNEVLVTFWNRPGQPPATPEPPEAKSITVLKLDDRTDEPLPGWEFSLFAGPDCQGQAIDFATTGPDGLTDFVGLSPAIYSVRESLRTGYQAVSPICQNVDLTDPPGPPPPCPTQPDLAFPDAGCDEFASGAAVKIDLSPIGQGLQRVTLNGPTKIDRKNEAADLDADGLDEIDTEIIQLDLTGTSSLGQVDVRVAPSPDSTGRIDEQTQTTPGSLDFPAESFFDVFVEVEVPGVSVVLHNEDPMRLECEISSIPPINCFYFPPIPDPIPLLDPQGQLIGYIIHAAHIPLPERETLVVFWNRPQVGPEEDVPLAPLCNFVTWTGADATPPSTVASRVSPAQDLEALWALQPPPTWKGFSPRFAEVSDMQPLDTLDIIAVCMRGPGTFTREVI